MTAKRFAYIMFDGFEDNGEPIMPHDVANLLNELHEENERLKKRLAEREKMLDVRDKIIRDVSKALNRGLEE